MSVSGVRCMLMRGGTSKGLMFLDGDLPGDRATRDAVLRLDRAALDAWWEALGLRDAGWWRTWKRPLPDAAR